MKIRKSARFRKLNTGFVLRFSKRKKSNAANSSAAAATGAKTAKKSNLEKTETRLEIRNNRKESNEWSIEQVPLNPGPNHLLL